MERRYKSRWLTSPEGIHTIDLAQPLKQRGLLIDQGSVFYGDPNVGKRKLCFELAVPPQASIQEGVNIIAEIVERIDAKARLNPPFSLTKTGHLQLRATVPSSP